MAVTVSPLHFFFLSHSSFFPPSPGRTLHEQRQRARAAGDRIGRRVAVGRAVLQCGGEGGRHWLCLSLRPLSLVLSPAVHSTSTRSSPALTSFFPPAPFVFPISRRARSQPRASQQNCLPVHCRILPPYKSTAHWRLHKLVPFFFVKYDDEILFEVMRNTMLWKGTNVADCCRRRKA